MANKHPSLKRPRRKLFVNKGRASKQWAGKLALEDVDGLFDDIDSADLPSLVLDNSDESGNTPKQTTQPSVSKTSAKEDAALPFLPSSKQNINSEVPFEEHGPVKTSSPIEKNMAVICEPEQNSSISPILFNGVVKNVGSEPEHVQVPQPSGNVSTNHASDVVPLTEPLSSQKNEAVVSLSNPPDAQRGTPKKQQPPVSTKTISGPSSEESKSLSMEQTPVKASYLGREVTPFMQKLKEVGQAKYITTRKMSPVKVPPQPTPEPDDDDFIILDVDVPLWITIPKKNAASQNKSKTSSHDSTAEKGSSQETAQKEEAPETITKSPKNKGKLLKKQSTQVKNADDVPVNNDKPTEKQKQPLKKGSSKETETAVDGPEIAVVSKRGDAQFTESNNTVEAKAPTVSKNVKKVTQKNKSLKKTQKAKHTSEGEKEVSDDAMGHIQDPGSETHTHQEDQGSVSEKELIKSANKGKKSTKSSSAREADNSCQILGKRKRSPPGEFWLTLDAAQPKFKDNLPATKQNTITTTSPVKQSQADVSEKRKKGIVSQEKRVDKKDYKRSKNKRTKNLPIQNEDQEEENPVPPSPVQPSDHSTHLGDQLSPEIYQTHSSQKSSTPIRHQTTSDQLSSPNGERRTRKAPSDWWRVDPSDEADACTSPPQLSYSRTIKPPKKRQIHPKPIGATGHQALKRGRKSRKPLGGAPESPLSQSTKTLRSTLTKFKDMFKSTTKTPSAVHHRQHEDKDDAELPATDSEVPPIENSGSREPMVIMQDEKSDDESQQNCPLNSTFNVCMSGPSSKVDLEMCAQTTLSPLSQMRPAVSTVSDMCAPPLKPMVLQPIDKTNLTRWLQTLWERPANDSWDVTLEQFEWFFYQHRALGILEDFNDGAISSGKIILGSYMKKPLWVDHSATTVFHLLTSSLMVTVDLTESSYTPGHTFVVPCGHAYSIHNMTPQPAALFFTRVRAESSD